MIARTQKVQLTVEELNTLLTGHTDNGFVDTIPEIIEEFQRGSDPVDIQPLTNIEIENIINNSIDL